MGTGAPVDIQGGMGSLVLWLLVLGVGVVCMVEGQQYDPADCPPTCVCEHPRTMPVTWYYPLDVSNGVYIYGCTSGPYLHHLVSIFQTYPSIDGLEIYNSLSHIASRAGHLAKLITSIGNLTTLKVLAIHRNNLGALPDNIGKLSSLKLLDIQDNNLTALPDSIGDLKLLEVLSVSNNSLTHLPYSIGNLSSLVGLWAYSNRLTHLPYSVGNLSSLVTLNICSNRLTNLPYSIGNLTSLEELHAHINSLTQLPVSIGYLTSLQVLSVYTNTLTQLPYSIGNLTSLEELWADNNSLTQLPVSIGYLTSLQVLSVPTNNLTQLPYSIGNLTQLGWMDVQNNLLEELPYSMGHLSVLGKLDVSNNHLLALPSNIVQLPLLSNISAHHNNITSLDISSIVSVPHRHIDLSYNQIESIGPIPTQKLNFRTLDLSKNHLTSLDAFFFRLGTSAPNSQNDDAYNVRMFNVSHNSISQFTNIDGYPLMPQSKDEVRWVVDLSHNVIQYLFNISVGLNITQEELVDNLVSEHLTLGNNPLRCDCIDYAIYKDIKLVRNLFSLSCGGPDNLKGLTIKEVKPDQFTCLIMAECPEGCICTDVPSHDLLSIDCRNYTGTTLPLTLPSPWSKTRPFLYTLNFENGSLVNLENRDYLKLVADASFSHNQIDEIPAGFFNKENRFNVLKLDHNNIQTLPLYIDKWPTHVYLGHNEWRCACENSYIIQQIILNKDRVVDYNNVTCSFPDEMKNKTINSNICPENQIQHLQSYIIPLIVVGTLLVVLVFAIGFIYFKRVWIYKMFKWNPFQGIDAVEAGKEFDIFISYCEADFDYIENNILSRLEDLGFKICHHKVHFLAESIVENIHNAIMNSKRTLIFFSQAYMDSGLCMYEFYTAHTMQVKERRKHLVTIKDTEIDVTALETGMRSFFEHYTYIERESPQFWDKLLYALPAVRMNAEARRNADNAALNENEFEMVGNMGNDMAVIIDNE